MPTYDYQCDACNHKWELFQSITARPIRKCPECGRPKAKRLLGTGGGIIFRGSGFYQTDYRSESYKTAKKAETDTATSPAKTGKPPSSVDTTSSDKKSSGPKDSKNVA